MDMIINGMNGKGFGTMKFQYSRRQPVKPDPRFIPHDDKKLAENILGSFFCQFLGKQFESSITNYTHNKDDSDKKADITFCENSLSKGLQITQLQFTRHEERKAHARRIAEQLVNDILKLIVPRFPIIVNVFPKDNKSEIPLSQIKNGKSKILSELADHIAFALRENQDKFFTSSSPIWLDVTNPKLSQHYGRIVLNRVPPNCFPRFYGRKNVFINYDIDDVAFEEADADDAVHQILRKKNNGSSNMLLIWSDEFEIGAFDKKKVADKIHNSFISSTFEEVFFMTFTNNPPMFVKSLQLWILKGLRMPQVVTNNS
ncbi:MAG: hypothetical protein ABI675_25765 [Chitinophagaceae bacterium]